MNWHFHVVTYSQWYIKTSLGLTSIRSGFWGMATFRARVTFSYKFRAFIRSGYIRSGYI